MNIEVHGTMTKIGILVVVIMILQTSEGLGMRTLYREGLAEIWPIYWFASQRTVHSYSIQAAI